MSIAPLAAFQIASAKRDSGGDWRNHPWYERAPWVQTVCCVANAPFCEGPTVLGRIPGYMNTIFPAASLPVLKLAANLGLVLFLFLVGLEVDMRILFRNWKVAASVGMLGMVLPFGLGAYLSSRPLFLTC